MSLIKFSINLSDYSINELDELVILISKEIAYRKQLDQQLDQKIQQHYIAEKSQQTAVKKDRSAVDQSSTHHKMLLSSKEKEQQATMSEKPLIIMATQEAGDDEQASFRLIIEPEAVESPEIAPNPQPKLVRTRAPVSIKYQDKNNPQHTWTGRGKMPRWLVQAIADGYTKDDFKL